jgi:hypothetical protein
MYHQPVPISYAVATSASPDWKFPNGTMGYKASPETRSYQLNYLGYFLYFSTVADDYDPFETHKIDDGVHGRFVSRAAHCPCLLDLFLVHRLHLEMILETCRSESALP